MRRAFFSLVWTAHQMCIAAELWIRPVFQMSGFLKVAIMVSQVDVLGWLQAAQLSPWTAWLWWHGERSWCAAQMFVRAWGSLCGSCQAPSLHLQGQLSQEAAGISIPRQSSNHPAPSGCRIIKFFVCWGCQSPLWAAPVPSQSIPEGLGKCWSCSCTFACHESCKEFKLQLKSVVTLLPLPAFILYPHICFH